MKALILNNEVVELSANEFPVHSDLTWMDAPVGCEVGWELKGGVLQQKAAPVLTLDEQKKEYSLALETLLNGKAREKDYENQDRIAGYINSSNTTWAQEAADFIAWRDECWQYAYNVLDQVTNGQMEQPSIEGFINNAPTLVWS